MTQPTKENNYVAECVDVFNTHKIIDYKQSRDQNGADNYGRFRKKLNKRFNKEHLEMFQRDTSDYHFTRDLLERIDTNDFGVIVTRFRELYGVCDPSWHDALKCGLVITAGHRVGNYADGEFIFQDKLAAYLRDAGLNRSGMIIQAIMSEELITAQPA